MAYDKQIYDIAYCQARGLIGNTARELLARIGSTEAFFSFSQSQLASITSANNEIFSDAYRQKLLQLAQKEADFINGNNIKCLMIDSPQYPKRLDFCDDAPSMLFTLGKLDTNFRHSIGVVGTRHATAYGIDFIKRFVADFSKLVPDTVIVSGLAYGADVTAHKAAMDNGLPTVAVLAHGLNTIYPADHRSVAAKIIEKGGLLVTEYPSYSRIHRANFLSRNRIVAGLCDALVVVESDIRGGSMSTARIASLYSRDVFALPGRVTDQYSRGTNYLIANQTASILTCAKDVIEALGWEVAEQKESSPTLFPTLTPMQKKLYDFIIDHPNHTSNDICVELDLSYASFTDLIFQLEMKDAIMCIPGGRYAPTAISCV